VDVSTHRIAGNRDDARAAVSPRVPPEPAGRSDRRRTGSPDGLWYRTVARYRSFREAMQAVDHLQDQGFPELSVMIVARDLAGPGRATRRLLGWRAAGRSALAASAGGALIGWLLGVIGMTGASVVYLMLAGAWIGAMLGAVAGYARHQAVTSGQDLTEIGVTASTYQVQVDRRHAYAERLLARYWPTT
jgi:hypothetical protein